MLLCLIFRLTSPLILIIIAAILYASYRIKQLPSPVTLFGREWTVNQLCIGLHIAAIPILYLVGFSSILFWVIGKWREIKIIYKLTSGWISNVKKTYTVLVFFFAAKVRLNWNSTNLVILSFFTNSRSVHIGHCSSRNFLQHRCHRNWR